MQSFDVSELLGVATSNADLQADSVVEHRVHDNLSDGEAPKGIWVVSIVEHTNGEAVCAAFIIHRLLQVHFPLGTKVSYVLGRFADIQCGVTMALAICSSGCFRQAQVARHLLQAQTKGLRVLLVIVDAAFRFSTDALFQGLRPRYCDPESDTRERIFRASRSSLRRSAIRMYPQDAVQVLDLCVSNPRERLTHGRLKKLR